MGYSGLIISPMPLMNLRLFHQLSLQAVESVIVPDLILTLLVSTLLFKTPLFKLLLLLGEWFHPSVGLLAMLLLCHHPLLLQMNHFLHFLNAVCPFRWTTMSV